MAEKETAEVQSVPSPTDASKYSNEALPIIDPVIEKRILRRLDWKVSVTHLHRCAVWTLRTMYQVGTVD